MYDNEHTQHNIFHTIANCKVQFTLVAEQRVMTREHPKFDDDVPQFSGNFNEKLVDWVTDVRLWEAEHNDETKPRFGPRLYRRRFLLQRQQRSSRHCLVGETWRTSLWTTSSRRSKIMVTETLLKKMARRRWTNYIDMRQCEAEAMQDNVNREEMMSLSLQNSTKIALDEKMRGYWRMFTSALSGREIAGVRIITEGSTGLSALNKAIQPTIVVRRRQEVRDDPREKQDRALDKTGSAGDNCSTLADGEESESETDLESPDERCTQP